MTRSGTEVVSVWPRRLSASERAQIVSESFAAGAKVCAVASRHGIPANLLSYWRRRARVQEGVGEEGRFLPVVAAAAGRRLMAPGIIEIELSGGISVRVDAAVDEVALGRVLRVLR